VQRGWFLVQDLKNVFKVWIYKLLYLACKPDFDKVHCFLFMMSFYLLISLMLKIKKKHNSFY